MSSGENEWLAGRYRVVEQLGRGGMGVVWRAVDEVLGREVAVKELRAYNDSSGHELADLRLRMQREARAAARVRHPGVISVHDVTDHQGRPVIVMELVDGPSLDDVLGERGVLDPREAAAIGAKVLEALAAAHDVGVLHRDVKPGNVLIDRGGRVVLTDFGIAAMEDPGDGSTTHLTRSGEIVGSLDYLAPERAQGQQPGPASDVWALGATLYAAVEGSSPFRRTSAWSTLNAIVVEPLPEPVRAGVLAPVLRQLMDKDPARRPDARSAARLLAALAEGREAGPVTPSVPSSVTPPHLWAPTESNAAPYRPEGFGAPTHQAPPAPYAQAASFGTAGAVGSVGGVSQQIAPTAVPPRKKRSAGLIAATVAGVLLAGGGVTYALVERGGTTEQGQLAGGQAPTTPGTSPGQVLDPGGAAPSGSTAPTATPSKAGGKKTATPSASARAPLPGAGDTGGGGSTTTGGGGTGAGGTTTGGSTNGGSTNGGSTTGGGSTPNPAPVCHAKGDGKYDCEVWRTEKTYRNGGGEAGILNAGVNYFYCQADLGRRETSGEWTNVWWARTDDDSGNTNVYFSVVYIKGGDNDRPVPGLPVC